jgi:hypothetical protein
MRNNVFYLGLLAAASSAYLRRLGRRWGATDDEVHRPMPEDELIPHPMVETTHAITIQAAAAEVWPWLVQMGMDRGGWYTDPQWWDGWAEKMLWSFLSGTEKTGYSLRTEPSAHRIIAEFQDLKVGDQVLDGPAGTAFFTVAALEENRVLALYSDSHVRYIVPDFVRNNARVNIQGKFSWVFILNEVDADTTRLILRTRVNYGPRLFRMLTRPFFWPVDFLLARKMLRGIKGRVEQSKGQLAKHARGLARTYSGQDEPLALGSEGE